MKLQVWDRAGSVSRSPATEGELKTTEERLGIQLPSALADLFQIQNGGRTRFESYILPDNDFLALDDFTTLKEIGEECEFGSSDDDWNRIIEGTDKLVVISRHGYDTFLCLDYRSNAAEPSVVLIDAVMKPKEAAHYDSFLIYLEHLHREEDRGGSPG